MKFNVETGDFKIDVVAKDFKSAALKALIQLDGEKLGNTINVSSSKDEKWFDTRNILTELDIDHTTMRMIDEDDEDDEDDDDDKAEE